MSRWKGFAAAGLLILKTKPASLAKSGRCRCIVIAGCVVLFVSIGLMAGSGPSLPLPPRKPDVAAHASVTAAYLPSDRVLSASPYRSPLSGPQMDLYRDIFRTQAAGAMGEADALIARVKDRSLMGHVLAQRYLHPSYKAGFDELKNWLAMYGDHPQAARITGLANARMPAGHKAAVAPATYRAASIEELAESGLAAKLYDPVLKRTSTQNAEASALIRTILRQIQQYEPSAALRIFNEAPITAYLDNVEKDRIRALIASGYLYAGKMDEAGRLSALALKQSGEKAPMAGWVRGLVLWQQKDYAGSAAAFEKSAASDYASGWMISASSYWAGRAHQQAGHKRRAAHWYGEAAEHPRTFYGLLALGALGRNVPVKWAEPSLSRRQAREILSTDAGQRAEKLIAAGQIVQAEAEIRALYISGDKGRKEALLAYAYDRRLPSLTIRLAHAVSGASEGRYESALYPEMPWSPNQGYRIDRALLHAIVRQESRFNAHAENKGSGATGLMQLMPRTAMHVTGDSLFTGKKGRALLKTPEVSLDIGQKYVEELLNNSSVGQDLLSLAVAYNAGPGNLAKWKAERAGINDPLLFIETIPYAETRAFVERVMANYWLYRLRFDQPNESMTALAEGNWARYAAHDKGAVKFAAAE